MSVDRLDEVVNIYANIPDRSSLGDLPVRADCEKENLDALENLEYSTDDRVPSDAFIDFD